MGFGVGYCSSGHTQLQDLNTIIMTHAHALFLLVLRLGDVDGKLACMLCQCCRDITHTFTYDPLDRRNSPRKHGTCLGHNIRRKTIVATNQKPSKTKQLLGHRETLGRMGEGRGRRREGGNNMIFFCTHGLVKLTQVQTPWESLHRNEHVPENKNHVRQTNHLDSVLWEAV